MNKMEMGKVNCTNCFSDVEILTFEVSSQLKHWDTLFLRQILKSLILLNCTVNQLTHKGKKHTVAAERIELNEKV